MQLSLKLSINRGLLAAPLMWFAIGALACPDLNGSYTCVDPEDLTEEPFVSTQKQVNGAWQFAWKKGASEEGETLIIADNQVRENPLNDEDSNYEDTLTEGKFWCVGHSLIGDISSGPSDPEDTSWSFTYTLDVSIDGEGNLVKKFAGRAQVPPFGIDEPFELLQSCTRNN